jgi:hypothetical protein
MSNRGGDRALNRAIHAIALVRMRSCPRTRAYIARRTAEGKTTREIRRCLKRYIARELYRQLTQGGFESSKRWTPSRPDTSERAQVGRHARSSVAAGQRASNGHELFPVAPVEASVDVLAAGEVPGR